MVGIFWILTGCKTLERSKKGPVVLMFQNGVGLEFGQAGCSILDLGGASRLCSFLDSNSSDLFFQVGPAFSSPFLDQSEALNAPISEQRKTLLKIWQKVNTQFYSVDAKDLTPSLEGFLSDTADRKLTFLSSNLKRLNGSSPFETYFYKKIENNEFLFLSFSAQLKSKGPSDWKMISFSEALAQLEPVLIQYPLAQIFILGSLTPSERAALSKLLARPSYFLGGALNEINPTSWSSLGKRHFWAKAADLGRGIGLIYWESSSPRFVAKSLKKEMDATNQCSHWIEGLKKRKAKKEVFLRVFSR